MAFLWLKASTCDMGSTSNVKAVVAAFTQEMALVGAFFEIVKSLQNFVCSSSVDGDGWCKSSITLIIVTNNPPPAPGTASILAIAESVPRCQPSLYTIQCVVYIILLCMEQTCYRCLTLHYSANKASLVCLLIFAFAHIRLESIIY